MRVGYLVGTSYCGSTLTALLADSHPDVVSVGETSPNRPWRRGGIESLPCSCGTPLSSCPFWVDLFRRVQNRGLAFGPDNWSNDPRYVNPLMRWLFDIESDRPVAHAVRGALRRAWPAHRRRMRRVGLVKLAFIRAALDAASAQVFFDTGKGLGRFRHLVGLRELDLRAVHLVRDVRAFVRSQRKSGRFVSIAESAERWLRFQRAAERAFRELHGVPRVTIRYEELTSNPSAVMNRVFAHLEVPPFDVPNEVDPSEHHVIGNRTRLGGRKAVRPNEQWRDDLTSEESARILAIAGDMNRSYGYDD